MLLTMTMVIYQDLLNSCKHSFNLGNFRLSRNNGRWGLIILWLKLLRTGSGTISNCRLSIYLDSLCSYLLVENLLFSLCFSTFSLLNGRTLIMRTAVFISYFSLRSAKIEIRVLLNLSVNPLFPATLTTFNGTLAAVFTEAIIASPESS